MITIAITLAAAAAQQAAPVPSPAAADLAAWVAEVNRRLDRSLVSPAFNENGAAAVTFRRGADGRPIDITAKSGSPRLSRAAIATVRSVGTLPPMPASMPERQRITFRFLVGRAGGEDEYRVADAAMRAAAARDNVALAARLEKVRLAGGPPAGVQLAAIGGR